MLPGRQYASRRHGCHGFDRRKTLHFGGRGRFPFPRHAEGESYRDLLYADKLKRTRVSILFFEAELDHFTDALHESIQVPGLSVAAVEGRNRRDVIAFFVLLDEDSEFSLSFQLHGLFREFTTRRQRKRTMPCESPPPQDVVSPSLRYVVALV